MSLWVEPPELIDRSTERTLVRFEDPNWSLASAQWRGVAVVEMGLRRFPGDHVPALVVVTVDCERATARIGSETCALPALEAALGRAIAPRRPT